MNTRTTNARTMPAGRLAPATARNREPILDVLRSHLPASARVLEIASGTGEHAIAFARAMAQWQWQPTDADPDNLDSIRAWASQPPVPANLHPAMALDVTCAAHWPDAQFEAIVCINMVHIAPWEATLALLEGAAARLVPGGVLYLYGPYREAGVALADSNRAFDESLKARDPRWGLREREQVASVAREHGLIETARIAMPANNISLIYRRA